MIFSIKEKNQKIDDDDDSTTNNNNNDSTTTNNNNTITPTIIKEIIICLNLVASYDLIIQNV